MSLLLSILKAARAEKVYRIVREQLGQICWLRPKCSASWYESCNILLKMAYLDFNISCAVLFYAKYISLYALDSSILLIFGFL